MTGPATEADVRELAYALCTSSWHINLYPHEAMRPCGYHLDRAKNTLAILQRRREGKTTGPRPDDLRRGREQRASSTIQDYGVAMAGQDGRTQDRRGAG